MLGFDISSHGKAGRLYGAYSVSGDSEEEEDAESSLSPQPQRRRRQGQGHYNGHQGHHNGSQGHSPLYQHPAGLSDTPTSDNASDATLTDSELALARDSTLLVHNGCLLDSCGPPPDVPPRNQTSGGGAMMSGTGSRSMMNGGRGYLTHGGATLERHAVPGDAAEFEPSCVVRTPSGNVYIPTDIPKGTLDYKSNSSCSSPSKMDIQKNHERCSLGFGPPVPVLPVRNNLRRPGSTHHFPPPRFQFQKSFASRCTWKCTAIVFIILSLVLTAALTYISIANILHWSYNKMPCSVLVEEETSETLVKPLLETSAMGASRNTSVRLRPSSSIATPGGGGGGGGGGSGGGGGRTHSRKRRYVDGHDTEEMVINASSVGGLHETRNSVDAVRSVLLMHDSPSRAPLNTPVDGEFGSDEPSKHSTAILDDEKNGAVPFEPSPAVLDAKISSYVPLDTTPKVEFSSAVLLDPSSADLGSGLSNSAPLNSLTIIESSSSVLLKPSSVILNSETSSVAPLKPSMIIFNDESSVAPLLPSSVPLKNSQVEDSSSAETAEPSSTGLDEDFSDDSHILPDSIPSTSSGVSINASSNHTSAENSDVPSSPLFQVNSSINLASSDEELSARFESLSTSIPPINSSDHISASDLEADALSIKNFMSALDVHPPNNVNTLTDYSHKLENNIKTQIKSGIDAQISSVIVEDEISKTDGDVDLIGSLKGPHEVAKRTQDQFTGIEEDFHRNMKYVDSRKQFASDSGNQYDLNDSDDETNAESSTLQFEEYPLNEIDMNYGGKVVRRPRDFHGVRRLDRFAHPMAMRRSRFEEHSKVLVSPQVSGSVEKAEELNQSEEKGDWHKNLNKNRNPAFYSYGSIGDESAPWKGDDKIEIKLKDDKTSGFRETNLDYTPENLKRFMSYMNQQSQLERVFVKDVITTQSTHVTTAEDGEFSTSTETQSLSSLETGTEDIFMHDQILTNTTSFPVSNTNETIQQNSNDNKHVSDITNPRVPNNNNGNIIQLTLPEDTNHMAKRVFVNVTIGSESENDKDGKQQPLYVLSIAVPSFSNEVKSGAIETNLEGGVQREKSPIPSGVSTTPVSKASLSIIGDRTIAKVSEETTTVTPMVPGFRLWGSECQCSCPCLQEKSSTTEDFSKNDVDLVANFTSGIQNDDDSFPGNSTEDTEDASSSNEYYQDADGSQYLQLVYSPVDNSTESASYTTDLDENITSTTTSYDSVNSSDPIFGNDLLVDYNDVTDPVTVTDLPSQTSVPNVSFEEGDTNETSTKSVSEQALVDQDGGDFTTDLAETTMPEDQEEDLQVPDEETVLEAVSTVPEPVSTGCPAIPTTTPAPPPPILILEGAKTFPARSFPPDGTTFSQIVLGQKLTNEIAAYGYWNMQFYQSEAAYVKFDYNIPRGASIAVYGRRNALPTHTQYHILEVLSGFKARTTRASHQSSVKKEVTHYLEPGHWFLSLYNDDGDPQEITFIAAVSEDMTQNCPSGCSGKGSCLMGHCQCNPGFGGEDCSESVCPVLCSQKGEYINGECHCNPGWKGKECSMRHDECEVPDCNGHGHCANGKCACARGFKGKFCEEVDCPHPTCSGHGVCAEGGLCICKKGWKGADCAETDNDALQCLPDCSGHGLFDLETQTCQCEPLWTGEDCSRELCDLDCGPHGHCVADSCICNEGWGGEYCNLKLCDARCNEHGQCKNGTCLCVTGWNGRHCTMEGCPNSCSGHGQCRVNLDSLWECRCSDGWDGRDCSVLLEQSCSDGRDNDKDGLVDCEDPECCSNHLCRSSQLCVTSPKPIDILLRKQPPAITASFFERMKFLIEEGSLQNYARQENFNESRSAVVRGRVVTSMGMGLVGVRVSTSQVQEGFTLTREDGWFDLLVNGGGAVTLQFGRTPYRPQTYIVNVPWNEVVIIDTVKMYTGDDKPISSGPHACRAHDYDLMKPVVLATWKHGFQGSCPDKSAILAESQVVQESFQIPGTGLNLVYHSSRATGYLSTIQLQLTPETIPPTLKLIHLTITIEGILFDKTFEADPGIKFTYSWNRLNVYRQRVYGITTALVKVGFEYTDCKDIIYDVQTTKLSGHDMSISEVGGWNLDIHHRYNFHEGILQKGDGSNLYLKQKPRIIKTTLGDGRQRPLDCSGDCDATAAGSKQRLLAPVALAAAPDGSIYVGDFNLVRRIMVDGTVRTVVTLNVTRVAYRYHIALSPLDGSLYISDPESHQILRVRNPDDFSDPEHNWEPAVGSGERCLPGDEAHCGDGALARDAKLAYPKGVAVSGDNVLYFADGTNIRMVDRDGIVTTVIGNHMHKSHWLPIPCEGTLNIEEVHLRWPTDLAINPLDNSLHIVDDHMILQLTPDGRVKVVAGRPLHCPSRGHDSELATRATLVMPQSIAFAPTGDLFVAESDSQRINRVRVIGTDGKISHYAGAESKCNCLDRGCDCFEQDHFLAFTSKFNTISSVAVSPDGILHIADQANYRIRSVVASIPEARNTPTEAYQREYEVYSPDTQEVYVFNRFGQHVSTRNILTGETSYQFTYNVNTSNGKLSTVTDTSGNKVFLRRDYASQVNSIENTKGQKCLIRMSRMKLLSELSTPDNYNVTLDYHGPTGLLRSKLDSTGRSYVYNYDEFGRLTSAVTPTGKVVRLAFDLSVKGAMVKVTLDDRQPISMLIKGSTVVTKSGESEQRTMVGTDGSVSTTSPWGHVVSTDTIPYSILSDIDPILGESYPVPAKQKVEIGGDPANRFEWRYFMRKPSGAKFRSQAGGVVQVGRKLRVNGENLLTLEYDRETGTVAVFMDDRVELLNVTYDRTARPVKWGPRNGIFAGVELEYDRFSRLSKWRWGDLTESYGYDRSGRLAEIWYADGTSTLYTFKDLFSTLPLKVTTPRGSDYLLQYDDAGALQSLTTPRGHIHAFCLQTSLGFFKYQYYSPISRHPFELRYNDDGQILAKLYPHQSGRVAYVYDQSGKLDTVLAGLSSIHYTYQESTSLVKNIDIIDPSFELKHEFKYHVGLLKDEKLKFGSKSGLHNTHYRYQFDGNARISGIDVDIDGKELPQLRLKYSQNLGMLEGMSDLRIYRNTFNRSVMQDAAKEYFTITDYDSHARVKSVLMNIKSFDVFRMDLEYNSRGRISSTKLVIGRTSTQQKMTYSADGHILEVTGTNEWKYTYDENGNAISVTEQGQKLSLGYDAGDRVVQVGDVEFNGYDARGFVVRRGETKLRYNERGQLSFATERDRFTAWYRYDDRGRLLAMQDAQGNTTQLLYADPHSDDLVTHLHYPKTGRTFRYLYGEKGQLVAVETSEQRFYVASDQNGSPLSLFDTNGNIIKEIKRTPFGRIIRDSNPDFLLPVDYQGGIPDPLTGLLYLNKRWYDPSVGQWMTPDWERLANQLTAPTDVFIYRFQNNDPINPLRSQTVNYMTDLQSWLELYGYNLNNMLGSLYTRKIVYQPSAKISSPQLAPDFGVMSGLQCIVSKVTGNFGSLGFVAEPLLKMEARTRNLLPRVAYRRAVFGEGLLISRSGGRALVSVVEGVNSVVQDVVTSVFNNSHFLDLHFTQHDQDLFYFVKDNALKLRDDLEELRRLGGMFNVSTHETADGKELRLQSADAVVSLRYGADPAQDRHRLLKHAHKRAVERAWEIEKALVTSGLSGRGEWTEEEREELILRGRVDGYEGSDIHSVQRYPQLADDPGNVAFRKDARKKRKRRMQHRHEEAT